MEQQTATVAEDGAVVPGPGSAALLRPAIADSLARPPGAELLQALEGLVVRDDLTARELVEVCVALKRVESFCVAARLAATADLERALQPEPVRRAGRVLPAGRRAADELAPALGIAPQAASRWVALARRVERDLPASHDALADGRMDLTQLRVVDELTRELPATATAALDAYAARRVHRRTARQLHDDVEAEAQRLDPEHAARACAAGRAARDVALGRSPLPGCRRLALDLPGELAAAAWHAVNGGATAAKDRGVRPDGWAEARTVGQLRADLGVALLTGQADPSSAFLIPTPTELARLAEVQVVVAADTLTGASDLPATIPGVGPVDADHVRDLAGRTRMRRLVAEPGTGVLRSYGATTLSPPEATSRCAVADSADPRLARLLVLPVEATVPDGKTTRYVPPPALRRHVHTRDATCIGPACHHSARGTQLDHTVDFGALVDGVTGTTSDANLGSGCRRVHNGKTHGGWRLRQPTPGTFDWTSPTGRTYRRQATPLVPGWRHGDDEPP